MDNKEEYHDPDYPGTSVGKKEEAQGLSEEEKLEKIKNIIRREFSNEIEIRENEVMLIDQRMSSARQMLHRLRYALVSTYYGDQKLQLSNAEVQDEIATHHDPRTKAEVAAILRDGQRRLHPSLRKLLGKQSVDLEDILKTRARNKPRKDYLAMLNTKNYTIAADSTKTLRPESEPEAATDDATTSRPKKVPRHLEPKIMNVVTLDEATRNKMKYRYRIIIGNTSRYTPPASRMDRSTHKWLLYVRGPPARPDVSRVLTGVTVRLHHSYAPHHTVYIDKPPYHLSRRGWGEFPAKVELHFALPERNRPATVEHTIKLDRNYTGLQTLGAETVVDVWLYSTQEMLENEFRDDIQNVVKLKEEPTDDTEVIKDSVNNVTNDLTNVTNDKQESWLDFFTTNTTELDVDEMIIKTIKKEPETNDTEKICKEEVLDDFNDTLNTNDKITVDNENYKATHEIKTEPDVVNDIDAENIPNELLNQVTLPKKRIMKYMDPATGKIYYLEMDRNLDLSKVQEIVFNSEGNVKTAKISPLKSNGLRNIRKTPKKGGVSLLKPEVKSLLKNESKNEKQRTISERNFTHIDNDHCYLGFGWSNIVSTASIKTEDSVSPMEKYDVARIIKKEETLYEFLCSAVSRLSSIRVAVNYLLKKIPLISDKAKDLDFIKKFPFVVESEEKYWKLDFAKRRNIEWSRAKLINRILLEHFKIPNEEVWRTKQILIYSRLHGYYPFRNDVTHRQTDNETNEWSSWNDLENTRKLESNIKEMYPDTSDVTTLSVFNSDSFLNDSALVESIDLSDSDDEVEIVKCSSPVKVKTEVIHDKSDNLEVLPVESEEDRLRYIFIEKKCRDIGIELRNEDVGNGYSYSAVHAVLLSAMKSFAEEVIRTSLAVKLTEDRNTQPPHVWLGSSRCRAQLRLEHVFVATRAPRLRLLTSNDVAKRNIHKHYNI